MEPSKAARIRDFALAATILMAVGLFFVMAAIKVGVIGHYSSSFTQEAQEEAGNNDDSVPPKQIRQYVAVYRAMQRDHSLTIERACTQQGLTVLAFRDIERKIERNDQVRTRVREQLQSKNNPPAGAKGTSP
jgi:hypothetical protein